MMWVFCADYPDNHVTGPICRGDKWRPATAITPFDAPCIENGRWICCGNAESGKHCAARTQSHIGALLGPIGNRRLPDFRIRNMLRSDRRATQTTEIVAIKQVRKAVLT